MAQIRLEGVAKAFGSVAVVRGLDLVIEEGEFFTFVGPSGCGKSTLLNLIAGLEPLTRGRIRFDGEPVDARPPGARDVAVVFQSYALYPHMTVYENIAFPLKVRKERRGVIAQRVREVAQVLGLEALLERKPRQLSGGQRQRVALGRALVRRPRVFLMDEPLSNLDARLRLEMREELKRLHGRYGITTVYVTHDQEEAMALSDRMAVLDRGDIQQCGTPLEVYAEPANRFVAEFIGSPPINILAGPALRHPLLRPFRERVPAGREIVLGMRPSAIEVSAQPRAGALEARVTLLEPTGSDLWVRGDWAGQSLKGRALPGECLTLGAPAFFSLPAQVYGFDGASGERLF